MRSSSPPRTNPAPLRHAAWLACAAAVSIGGCSRGEPSPTEHDTSRSSSAPAGVVLPSLAEAQLRDGDVTEELARRFLVPAEVAQAYALSFARDKGGMAGELRVCASWQRVSQDLTLLASEHVIGAAADCEGWVAVLESARASWQPGGTLLDAHRASVGRFYTVAVAPYSFHHPLYEAHAGLPLWVLRAARLDGQAVPWRCEPRHVNEPADKNAPELGSYACPEGPVSFEHRSAQPIETAAQSARADVLASFRRWQRVLAEHYAGAIPSRIERLERLWSRHEQGGSP